MLVVGGGFVGSLGQWDGASFGVKFKSVGYVQIEGSVGGRDMGQFVVYFRDCGEDCELSGEDVEQDQRQGDEEDNWRESHQEIGNDEPVADLPEEATEDPSPEQRDAQQNQNEKGQTAQPLKKYSDVAGNDSSHGQGDVDDEEPECKTMDLASGRITAQAPEYFDLEIAQMSHLLVEFSGDEEEQPLANSQQPLVIRGLGSDIVLAK